MPSEWTVNPPKDPNTTSLIFSKNTPGIVVDDSSSSKVTHNISLTGIQGGAGGIKRKNTPETYIKVEKKVKTDETKTDRKMKGQNNKDQDRATTGKDGLKDKNKDTVQTADNGELETLIKRSVAASEVVMDNKVKEIDKSMKDNQKELLDRIGSAMAPLLGKIEKLEDRQDTMEVRQNSMEESIGKKFDKMKEELKEELRAESTTKYDKMNLAAFHYSLRQEIEHEGKKFLMFGIKTNDSETVEGKAKEILQNITAKAGITLEIKSVVNIGRQNKDKVGSVLVVLDNTYQRNELLRNGKHIPEGITIDRCTPPLYREAYKKMKKKSRTYSRFFNTQTQINFIGHTMQLRYKEEGKAYTIVEEFVPTPEEAKKLVKGNKTEGDSTNPSMSINKESIQDAKRFVVLSGHAKSSEKEFKEWLEKSLGEEDIKEVTEVEKVGKAWRVGFKDEEKAKHVAQTHKDKKSDGIGFKAMTFDF